MLAAQRSARREALHTQVSPARQLSQNDQPYREEMPKQVTGLLKSAILPMRNTGQHSENPGVAIGFMREAYSEPISKGFVDHDILLLCWKTVRSGPLERLMAEVIENGDRIC